MHLAPRWPALEERERYLPAYVQEEFEAYLKCGRLEHGFLWVRCTTCQAERLVAFSCKRVFKLDLTSCENCGGQVRVIACSEDPAVIGRILAHLDQPAPSSVSPILLPPARGAPGGGRLEQS